MTHVVEGRVKEAQEETNKEKAFKQVAKASLQEKTLGLNVMERRATTVEKELELAEQKARDLQGRLRETKLKLAKTASILFA